MKVYVLDSASKIEDSAIQWGWSQMPAERVARVKKMTTSKGRMMHVAAFLLLSYGLKEHQIDRKGIVLAYKNGKPYLTNRAIYFNISHSHDAVACGISKDECGVDIEKVRPVSDKLLKRVCSQEERGTNILSFESRGGFCGDMGNERVVYQIKGWQRDNGFKKSVIK